MASCYYWPFANVMPCAISEAGKINVASVRIKISFRKQAQHFGHYFSQICVASNCTTCSRCKNVHGIKIGAHRGVSLREKCESIGAPVRREEKHPIQLMCGTDSTSEAKNAEFVARR